MKRNKPNKFIKFTDRTEVQSETVDPTKYTDQLFSIGRQNLMKNVELGFPEPGMKFLNGTCVQTTTLIENLESAIEETNRLVDNGVVEYIQNVKNEVLNKQSGTPELQHEESDGTSEGNVPKN